MPVSLVCSLLAEAEPSAGAGFAEAFPLCDVTRPNYPFPPCTEGGQLGAIEEGTAHVAHEMKLLHHRN